MKKIFLAPKGKRMLARLIDFLIMLACSSILYFTAVFPNSFDRERYLANSNQVVALYQESGLFITNELGNCSAKSNFKSDVTSIDKLYDVSLMLDSYVVDHNNMAKDLYIYYTTDLNIKYGGDIKLTYEAYKSNILKVGSEESNIADFVVSGDSYTFTLIDESKASTTLSYFLKVYDSAATTVHSSSIIKDLRRTNSDMVIYTLVLIIPCVVGFSFIFDGLVPIFSKYGQTIGKYIMHLIVLTSDGHKAKKIVHLLRWVIYIIELLFGIATFGGGLLIPYTVFLFTKKRQTIHDFAAKTVVVDANRSIFYDSAKEEAYITNRLKEKGLDIIDEPSDSSGTSPEE